MTLRHAIRLYGRARVRAAWEIARFILVGLCGTAYLVGILWLAMAILEYAKRNGY